METSPSQRLEVIVLADQDFEDIFLEDTQARLGRVSHREYDHVVSLSTNHLPSDTKIIQHSHNDSINNCFEGIKLCYLHV